MTQSDSATDRDARLDGLIARQDIHDALMRYCSGIDRGDLALVLSAFHDDALDNHSGVVETAVERFTRTVVEGGPIWTSHNIGNILIQLNGASAVSQSCFTAWHRLDIEGRTYDWVIAGRYLDRFECRAGDWRISYRTVVYDCQRFDEVQPIPGGHAASTFFDHVIRGSGSKADFFYELFRF
jgi:hypothetical protein